jgi:hypothetical protein
MDRRFAEYGMGHERDCGELGPYSPLAASWLCTQIIEKPDTLGCLADIVPIADFSGWCDRIGEVSNVIAKPTIS